MIALQWLMKLRCHCCQMHLIKYMKFVNVFPWSLIQRYAFSKYTECMSRDRVNTHCMLFTNLCQNCCYRIPVFLLQFIVTGIVLRKVAVYSGDSHDLTVSILLYRLFTFSSKMSSKQAFSCTEYENPSPTPPQRIDFGKKQIIEKYTWQICLPCI